MALLGGCGGGGSSVTGGGSKVVSTPPVTVFSGYLPHDSALSQFKSYAFSASATATTIGRTIANYRWDFGDSSPVQTVAAVSGNGTINYAYKQAGSFALKVTSVDDQGTLGTTVTTQMTVATMPTPVTVVASNPIADFTLQALAGTSIQAIYSVTATTTSGGTIVPAGFTVNPGEAAAVVGTITGNGNVFSIPVTYQAGASLGSRTLTPTVTVVDSNLNSSDTLSLPAVTIKTSGANHPPSVIISSPAGGGTSGFTSKEVDLAFTIADSDGDVLNYKVDWGDGTAVTPVTASGDSSQGIAVALKHAYPDSFTTSSRSAVATVTVDDGRTGAPLPAKTVTYVIAYNTLPTATITSPQGSGTLPSVTVPGVVIPPTSTDPDVVVVANGGKLSFNGTATLPGSGDAGLTYKWTFENATPLTSASASTGDVIFNGTAGQLTPCKVELTVTDAFGRKSNSATGLNSKTYQKWVIVDGTNTQKFSLAFLYRQKSDNNGPATLSPVISSANGLGAVVKMFQDGISSSYTVQSGNQASVEFPVRSNLAFYLSIPAFSGSADGNTYMIRIPNSPAGRDADPTLLGTVQASDASSFTFANSAAPYDPTLKIVTGQGFAPELDTAAARKMQLTVDLVLGQTPANNRWLDRLSVPMTDANAIEFATSNSGVGIYSGLPAYQSFAEWPIFLMTMATKDLSASDSTSSPGLAKDLGFVFDHKTYTGDTQKSETFSAMAMQAYRVPASTNDPYDLSVKGVPNWNQSQCFTGLFPVEDPAVATAAYFQRSLYGAAGTVPLTGGLQKVPIPYDANSIDRIVIAPTYRDLSDVRKTLSYSEYLWSLVWARPLVLNSARVSTMNMYEMTTQSSDPAYLANFPYFRHSNPPAWPKFIGTPGIPPDNSNFDLTPHGNRLFASGTPVSWGGAAPSGTAVGRFYWAAFNADYSSASGGLISRTWLSDEDTKLIPSTVTGLASGDAVVGLGFIPPQDTVVDKRKRNPDGSVVVPKDLGGYRVTWFNPTKDATGNVVPPDFWVVELATSNPAATVHFMLPGSFPAAPALQSLSDPILTDARLGLPSGQNPALVGDKVAPGYCWFDVPPELRPATGSSAVLTIFALKSVYAKHIQGLVPSRALNRTDWIDAIKTATATISIKPSSGRDISYAHKIPFNYPWDIVVVNGPATIVAP